MKQKILAGVLGGLLAGIISVIPIIGWLWFVWAALGGLAAVFIFYLWVKPRITLVDGLIVAGIAGLVGAVLNFLGVVIFAVLAALFSAFVSSATDDKMAAFTSSLLVSLISIGINLGISVLMFLITLVVGFLLGLVLYLVNKPSTPTIAPPPPVNPFNQPGR
jgi:hypothetical protein